MRIEQNKCKDCGGFVNFNTGICHRCVEQCARCGGSGWVTWMDGGDIVGDPCDDCASLEEVILENKHNVQGCWNCPFWFHDSYEDHWECGAGSDHTYLPRGATKVWVAPDCPLLDGPVVVTRQDESC